MKVTIEPQADIFPEAPESMANIIKKDRKLKNQYVLGVI